MKNSSIEKINTKLKVNDNVVVIGGSDRGKRGKVLRIDRTKGRILVEGVNKRSKFLKPNQDNPKGGVVTLDIPIHISNVMFFCDKCKKGVKVGIELKDKTKARVCRSCGKSLDK